MGPSVILVDLLLFVAGQRLELDTPGMIATIEQLQSPVEDLRCEFEGTRVAKDDVIKKSLELKDSDVIESFTG